MLTVILSFATQIITTEERPVVAGDTVRLNLVDNVPGLPAFILGTIQGPIERVKLINPSTGCKVNGYRYTVTYDEDDLEEALTLLLPAQVVSAAGVTCCEILQDALEVETAARITADNILRPKVGAEVEFFYIEGVLNTYDPGNFDLLSSEDVSAKMRLVAEEEYTNTDSSMQKISGTWNLEINGYGPFVATSNLFALAIDADSFSAAGGGTLGFVYTRSYRRMAPTISPTYLGETFVGNNSRTYTAIMMNGQLDWLPVVSGDFRYVSQGYPNLPYFGFPTTGELLLNQLSDTELEFSLIGRDGLTRTASITLS